MIKICFFHSKAYAVFNPSSEANIGGTEVQLCAIAKALSRDEEYEASFVTGDFGQLPIEQYGSIKVYKSLELKNDFWHYAIAPFKIWKSLKKVNADIYFASSAGPETGIIALFCKLNRKKFIYRTAHEIDCSGEYIKNNGISGRIFEYGIRNADIILTQSLEHQKLLKDKMNLPSIIFRNSYFISTPKNEKRGYVLWVARCEKWKNPEMFLRIAEKNPQFNFVMVCPKQKYQEDLFSIVFAIAEEIMNLKFIESVPFQEIQRYFDEAKLFVGTSDYEGFPNTYLQACMAGTLVVSYAVNPDNFINEYNLGYFSEKDENLLIEQIRKIMKDDSDWEEKSKNALRYVKENHDIEKNILKLEEILNKFGK